MKQNTATTDQYREQTRQCRTVFFQKLEDYGTSWRILRLSSLIDQIFIKAQRLRNIEEQGVQKVHDGKDTEYIGIVNYSVISLIQQELGPGESGPDRETLEKLYDKHVDTAFRLMNDKNHDYGEAWRKMYISSLTDLILVKLYRIRQILEHNGKTKFSEGIDANIYDIINYSVFALIRLNEIKNNDK